MSTKIFIIDYGLGNLHSVAQAFSYLGADVEISTDAKSIEKQDYVILPGVGAFSDGIAHLEKSGQADALREYAKAGRPLMGICLGAQLLLDKSEEFGEFKGLGIISGSVDLLEGTEIKIPHVGWQEIIEPVEGRWKNTVLKDTPLRTWTYFVHSYHAVTSKPEETLAVAHYGDCCVTAAVQSGNVYGMQFHPEKSGKLGLGILKSFMSL